MIGLSFLRQLNHIILLTNTGFTTDARRAVERELPTTIELFDLNSLRSWARRVERRQSEDHTSIVKAITDISKLFARIIARNPRELANMEWRDMERMLANVFEQLGFAVELTPSSKDGGKDIVLECVVSSSKKIYVVEIKHWRSHQRVGKKLISDFINVIATENHTGGLYLATYGYSSDAFEALTEIERGRVHLGSEDKIVSLCKTFVKAESGIWSPPSVLPDLLFDN